MEQDGRDHDPEELPGPEDRDDVAGSDDEADAEHGPGTHTALPPKIEAWRRRSAAGAILTGFALGLQEALETRKEEPSIMMETSGEPPKDLPVEADFEYGRPRQSVVQIRPWLLSEGGEAPAGATGERAAEGPAPAASGSDRPESPGPGSPGPDGTRGED